MSASKRAAHKSPPRRLHLLFRVLLNCAAALGVLSVLVAGVVWLSGARVIVFSTGSMAPAIPAGSLAVTTPVTPSDLGAGDVVTVERPSDGRLVTHRIVSLVAEDSHWFATLRGDANNSDDAAPYLLSDPTQRVLWSAPGLGQAVSTLQSPWLFLGVLALLAIIAVPTSTRNRRATFVSPTSEQVAEIEAR